MGYYVNPPGESKEGFLAREGTLVTSGKISWSEVPEGKLPVVLVDNGWMTAAAIAYSEAELAAFHEPDDDRPKKIYLVQIERLMQVSDLWDNPDFKSYLN